jgi:two-component system, NarL family, nitrate/nitrite response regulator NarL
MGQPEIAIPDPDSLAVACTSLRAVIDCLDDSGSVEQGKSERVLMDVDLDGCRYLLVRMPPAARNAHSLSPREVEIVRLVAEGHPNKVIAAILDISAWTVCTHVRRVFMKLGVTSRAAMVARMAEFARQPEARRGSPAPQLGELASASIDPSSFGRKSERLAHRQPAPTATEFPVAMRSESGTHKALKRGFSIESRENRHSARRDASR